MIHYETVFVLPGDLQPQRVDEFVEKVKSLIQQKGGEVTLTDKWGRRRLAYPIRRQREGYYTFLQFKSAPSFVAELTRLFQVSEEVIRQVICRALKGKPASPTMVVTPAGMDAQRPPFSAAAPVAPAAPAPVPPSASTPVPEASHADAPAPAAPQ